MIRELITSKSLKNIEENAEFKSNGNMKSLGNVISFVDESEKQRPLFKVKTRFHSSFPKVQHCKMHFVCKTCIKQDFG